MEEEKILKLLNNPFRKSKAFSELVVLYQERLYFHIRKMVISHDDANDILQNTFLKSWSNLDSFRGDSKLLTWLYRIATNETITFLNSKRLKYTSSLDEVDSYLMNSLQADVNFNGDEAEYKLQQAILTLPEKQRLVFNMKYFDELTYEQMQEILETSVGALKASYHHAVKKIQKYLVDNEFTTMNLLKEEVESFTE